MRRIAWLVPVLHLLARAAAAAGTPDAPVRLTDVGVQGRGDAVLVEIKTSGAPKYKSELMGGPVRLVLDFENATYAWAKAPVAVGTDPVKEIRGSQYRKGIARVVIELTRKAPYALEPHAGGLRVVFAAPAVPAFKLQGIVLRDEGSIAYLADTATGKVGAYRVGEKLGDAVLETIEERHVVLRTPRGPVEMRLEDPRPAPRATP